MQESTHLSRPRVSQSPLEPLYPIIVHTANDGPGPPTLMATQDREGNDRGIPTAATQEKTGIQVPQISENEEMFRPDQVVGGPRQADLSGREGRGRLGRCRGISQLPVQRTNREEE